MCVGVADAELKDVVKGVGVTVGVDVGVILVESGAASVKRPNVAVESGAI